MKFFGTGRARLRLTLHLTSLSTTRRIDMCPSCYVSKIIDRGDKNKDNLASGTFFFYKNSILRILINFSDLSVC